MSETTAVTLIPEPMAVRGISQETFDKQALFRADLEGAMPQLLAVLPKGVSGKAMTSMALTCALDNPDLLDCEPLSLVRATFKMAVLGLRPGETCDIVPTKKGPRQLAECWVRVKGVVELAMRARAIQWAKYILICDGDEWSFQDETLVHHAKGTPALDCSNVAYVSAMVILPSGVRVYEQPWSRERVLAHRNKYAKGLDKPGSPWKKDPQAMWGKVVLKSLMRFAPLSPELREAFSAGDEGEVSGGFEIGGGDPTAALRAGAGVLALGDGDAERAASAESDGMPRTLADAEAVVVRGKTMREMSDARLASVLTWAKENQRETLIAACDIVIAARMDAEATEAQWVAA